MKYGIVARFIRAAFSKTAFDYIGGQLPALDMSDYKRRVYRNYREIVARTPSVGSMRENEFAMTLYAGCFFMALHQAEREQMTDELVQGLIKAVSYCPVMTLAKKGRSAFTERDMKSKARQAEWCRAHIGEYPINWYFYFDKVEGKDEFFVTHKQCAICKLTRQEGCEEVTKYLCAMDYYAYDLQGAVLDRTKTLGYGDDECNFHVMSLEWARELGFVRSENAR